MLGGGHLKGYKVSDKAKNDVLSGLDALADEDAFAEKYGIPKGEKGVLLFLRMRETEIILLQLPKPAGSSLSRVCRLMKLKTTLQGTPWSSLRTYTMAHWSLNPVTACAVRR